MIELHFGEASPSLNTQLRSHWTVRTKTRTRWEWMVTQARLAAKCFDPPNYPKVKVTVVRTGRKRCDPDNAAGGLKVVLDILVRQGFFVDDSPDHLELVVHQKLGLPATLVRIEPA